MLGSWLLPATEIKCDAELLNAIPDLGYPMLRGLRLPWLFDGVDMGISSGTR